MDPSLNGYDAQRGCRLSTATCSSGWRAARRALGRRRQSGPIWPRQRAAATSPSRVIAPRKTKKSAPQLDGLSAGLFPNHGHSALLRRPRVQERDGAGAPKVADRQRGVREALRTPPVTCSENTWRSAAGDAVKLDREIVGIVRDSKYGGLRETGRALYLCALRTEREAGTHDVLRPRSAQ